MKILIISLFLAISPILSHSQDCNIGNQVLTPEFEDITFGENYLLGVHFTLSQTGVLHSLNNIGQGSGANFQMAIYDDNGGVPNNLIAFTAPSIVGTGIISLPVNPIELSAGDYWIMAIYQDDDTDFIPGVVSVVIPNTIFYTPLLFGNPMPTNGFDFISYTGGDLLYFAEISCGALSV